MQGLNEITEILKSLHSSSNILNRVCNNVTRSKLRNRNHVLKSEHSKTSEPWKLISNQRNAINYSKSGIYICIFLSNCVHNTIQKPLTI